MKLREALRLPRAATIAIVGAGGKTTALLQLARELNPCLVTTTTHFGRWQVVDPDRHFIWEEHAPMPDIEPIISTGNTFITGQLENDKYIGLSNEQVEKLKQLAGYHDLPLLIEADGARQKALKAPAEHEPAIPPDTEVVIVIAGLASIGKPLLEENVHRAENFSKLSGTQIGEFITTETLVRVLTHPTGGLKNIPEKARKIVLLNQADSPELQATGNSIARHLLSSFHSVVIASLAAQSIYAVHERVAGIILAAGKASRFGQPKQLLDYKGRPFVRVVAEAALEAGLSPVVVVTGAYAEQVEAELGELKVNCVRNEAWQDGQSTSIQAGLAALNKTEDVNTGAAVFLLADQPQVTPTIIRALVERHALRLYPIVAPLVDDRRANPVLFDRLTFDDLLALKGDVGGRAIFSNYNVEYMPWYDEKLLLDVDTYEDYAKLLEED
jgi:molybdenum cofactor cytidylyltransferase